MEHHDGLAFVLLEPSTPAKDPGSSTPASPLPCVICFHGSGHQNHYETWKPLVQAISLQTRVLFYERPAAEPRAQSPREAIHTLTTLLTHLHLAPPYILLAHSYGGTFAREFLQHHPRHVAGMVLAETGQEAPTAYDEEQYRRRVLGDKPLSVIHAKGLLLGGARRTESAGAAAAGGDMLRRWGEEDERLKRAQLRLSTMARYVCVEGCGHHVVRDRRDVVEGEVRWVLGNLVAVEAEKPDRSKFRVALSRFPLWFSLRKTRGSVLSTDKHGVEDEGRGSSVSVDV